MRAIRDGEAVKMANEPWMPTAPLHSTAHDLRGHGDFLG